MMFGRIDWRMRVIFLLATVIFYVGYPFIYLYEILKENRKYSL